MRFASFNIRNGRAFDGLNSWPLRAGRVRRFVASLDADVLGLQEVYRFQLRSLSRGLPEHAVAAGGRERGGGGEHVPLFWRTDRFRATRTELRWFSSTPRRPGSRPAGARVPRMATIADLESLDGAGPLRVANVHLDAHDVALRRRAAIQLADWLPDDRPTVVLGDLNDEPDSATVAILVAAGFRDALAEVTEGTDHGFAGHTRGPRLDHVLVRGPFEIRRARVVTERGRPPSDHWPVVADLTPRNRPA